MQENPLFKESSVQKFKSKLNSTPSSNARAGSSSSPRTRAAAAPFMTSRAPCTSFTIRGRSASRSKAAKTTCAGPSTYPRRTACIAARKASATRSTNCWTISTTAITPTSNTPFAERSPIKSVVVVEMQSSGFICAISPSSRRKSNLIALKKIPHSESTTRGTSSALDFVKNTPSIRPNVIQFRRRRRAPRKATTPRKSTSHLSYGAQVSQNK